MKRNEGRADDNEDGENDEADDVGGEENEEDGADAEEREVGHAVGEAARTPSRRHDFKLAPRNVAVITRRAAQRARGQFLVGVVRLLVLSLAAAARLATRGAPRCIS